MWSQRALFLLVLLCGGGFVAMGSNATSEPPSPSKELERDMRSFEARGVIKELGTNGRTALVQHEAVAGYMPAMTMPFKVLDANQLVGLRAGDRISFRLCVTGTESWIDDITRIGSVQVSEQVPSVERPRIRPESSPPKHPLMSFKFTNELGQAVALDDFRGQALAITFFFTRCPIPDYCPRLSKNFQEAAKKLGAVPGGPTNWHFLSVSFDMEFDNPRALRGYGELYHYDPAHWSFLTGPAEQIGELARLSDVTFARDGASFNHNFRTLIIDTTGHLQMVFPTGGNLSDAIVAEILKAAAVTNESVSHSSPEGQEHEANQEREKPGFHGG